MENNSSAYRGIYTAGNNHYHGARSIIENGALAHANKLAHILLREGKVASEEEALSLANFEVQRLRWDDEKFQANRMAREELRLEREQQLDRRSVEPLQP
ncbi:MAG: hypothetical protein JNL77_02860 [Nitrosomonas sp.]|nr:hypothetical protein [Nitrosomonas sp.]